MPDLTEYDAIKRITDFDFKGKRVLMRVDFNVPQDEATREITSDARIKAALPSIRYVLEQGAEQLYLISHLGKPKKEAKKGNDFTVKLSHDKTAQRLEELLGEGVILFKDYLSLAPPSDRIVLLENIRFHHELEQSDNEEQREQLAKHIAGFADLFINDAFGTCHRKEALIYDVVKFLPSGIGFLVDSEIRNLSQLLQNPRRPYIAILGGAKVEDKINVIEAMSQIVDKIYIVGAMAFAFQKALGYDIGKSFCEGVDVAKKVVEAEYWNKVVLPADIVAAVKQESGYSEPIVVEADKIPENYAGLDIGEQSVSTICDACSQAGTVFWNGPAGMFEVSPFDRATYAIARHLAGLSNARIIGGGDSVTAIEKANLPKESFTHISTGGGASLEYIENKGRLPALDILAETQK